MIYYELGAINLYLEGTSISVSTLFKYLYRAYSRKKGHAWAQLWIFTPRFFKIGAFRMLYPSKQHVFFEFLVEEKAFHFSKGAQHGYRTQ